MAGICARVARGLLSCCSMRSTIHSSSCLQRSPTSASSWAVGRKDLVQPPQLMLVTSLLCRHFSSLSVSPRLTDGLVGSSKGLCPSLRVTPPHFQTTRSVLPVRTVVRHSKLGKMKTVKAVAKRFRRTGSGKLKFWPPGNVHNLLSKSHDRKCRIRKPRYANKTQLRTLNKMLNGWYS